MPSRISVTLHPGASHSEELQVHIGDTPIGKGDIMFLFDRTGSMSGEIGQAKASAAQITNDIRAQLPYAWFGVGSFMDYPSYYEYPGYADNYGDAGSGDQPWIPNIQLTDSITDVATTINSLWLGWGVDWPECYTRVLYEAGQMETVGWRAKAKKVIVLFGDAPTHDLDFAGYNFGGDPGRDGIAQTSDDLDFETVVRDLDAKGISVIAVDSGDSSESAATFQGMSIGYDTLQGTHGRYFQLDDVSQLPAEVVNLVLAETGQIDRLSLHVTEGYEGWLKVNPPEYTDVGANITVTFGVTVQVPAGTASGFYPFMIQAIGDGAILGVTYVDVTVPADSPISDLGFRPDPNGFRFVNDVGSTESWEMFKQFYGAAQVEYPNGDRLHPAEVFFEHSRQSGGNCDGFAATSMLNYKGLTQPNAGSFTLPSYSRLYSQGKDDAIWDAIVFAQNIQKGKEIGGYRADLCHLLQKSPSRFYAYLKAQIENDSPAVLDIAWNKDYYVDKLGDKERVLEAGYGHALLPYRFEEPSSDKARVYTYDSNIPGNDEHYVEFDLTNDTWSYRWPVPLWPDITIGGDVTECLLYVTPLELYRHQGVAWWALAGGSTRSSLASVTAAQLFATSGPARLLFTDDEGRRLGWDGAAFYDEIPGAQYSPDYAADGGGVPSGYYYIPTDVRYDLKVYGAGVGQADVSVLGNGYALQLADLQVVTGTINSLQVSPDVVTVGGVVSSTRGTLSVTRMLANEDRTVTVGNLAVDPGEEVLLQLAVSDTVGYVDTAKLSTNSPVSRVYDLSVERAGGVGYAAAGHAAVVLDSNSDSFINVPDWSNLGVITISVDLDRDGIVDATRPVSNEARLQSIVLEASRRSAPAGGEKVSLSVALRDQFGAYVADSTLVSFSSTLGTLSADEATIRGGLVHLALTTGNQPGEALITARSGGISASLEVAIYSYIAAVTISGPTLGVINTAYDFTATANPISATTPITFTWEATGQMPQTYSSTLTNTQGFGWPEPGPQTITVTATNGWNTVTATHALTIVVPSESVDIGGPVQGVVNTGYDFLADVSPITVTIPLTYTWTPEPQSGQGTSQARYSWATDGEKVITVTAANAGGVVTGTHRISIVVPPGSVTIAGAAQGVTNQPYDFAALVSPLTATEPLTYTWLPEPVTGQSTAYASYSWPIAGMNTITVTAQNAGGIVTATHSITIAVPPGSVAIDGPAQGAINQPYDFVALVRPFSVTEPLTYTWIPEPLAGQGTDTVRYTWTTAGTRTITVTVANAGGMVTATHSIAINQRKLYLPLLMKAH